MITLADFIAPLSTAEFTSTHWTRKPFVGQLPEAAIRSLQQFAGEDVHDMLKETHATRCMLWFETPQGPRECRVPIADAFAFYEAGATLFFNHDTQWATSLSDQLHQDLGMTPSIRGQRGSFPSVFASRSGHGSKLHFDRFEIFSLQLKGRKDWWIAPPALENVDENFSIGDELWPKFDAYRIDALAPPEKAAMRQLTLEPGAMLYLPRGYWHQTLAHADSDSVALSFAFGPPTLRDILLPLIDHIATRDKRWRSWSGFQSEHKQSNVCREVMADLVQQLNHFTEDLYTPTSGTHVTRNPLVTLGVTGPHDGERYAATLKFRGVRQTQRHVLLTNPVLDRLRGYWQAHNPNPQPVTELDDTDRILLELGYLRHCQPKI